MKLSPRSKNPVESAGVGSAQRSRLKYDINQVLRQYDVSHTDAKSTEPSGIKEEASPFFLRHDTDKVIASRPRKGKVHVERAKSAPRQSHRRYVNVRAHTSHLDSEQPEEETPAESFTKDASAATARIQSKIAELERLASVDMSALAQSESDSVLLTQQTDYAVPPQYRRYMPAHTHTEEVIERLEEAQKWMQEATLARGSLERAIHTQHKAEEEHVHVHGHGHGRDHVQASGGAVKEHPGQGQGHGHGHERSRLNAAAGALHAGLMASAASVSNSKVSNQEEDEDEELDEFGEAFDHSNAAASITRHRIVTHGKTRNTRETIYLARTSKDGASQNKKHARGSNSAHSERDERILSPEELFWRGSLFHNSISINNNDQQPAAAPATDTDPASRAGGMSDESSVVDKKDLTPNLFKENLDDNQRRYSLLLSKAEKIKSEFAEALGLALQKGRLRCESDLVNIAAERRRLEAIFSQAQHESAELDQQLKHFDLSGIQIQELVEKRLKPTVQSLQDHIEELRRRTDVARESTRGALSAQERVLIVHDQVSALGKSAPPLLILQARTMVHDFLQNLKQLEQNKATEVQRQAALTRARTVIYTKVLKSESGRREDLQERERTLQKLLESHEAEVNNGRSELRKKIKGLSARVVASAKRRSRYEDILDTLRRHRLRKKSQEERLQQLKMRRTVLRGTNVLERADTVHKAIAEKDSQIKSKERAILRKFDAVDSSAQLKPPEEAAVVAAAAKAEKLRSSLEVIEEALNDDYDNSGPDEDDPVSSPGQYNTERKARSDSNEKVVRITIAGDSRTEGNAAGVGPSSANERGRESTAAMDVLGLRMEEGARDARIENKLLFKSLVVTAPASAPLAPLLEFRVNAVYKQSALRKSVLSSVLTGAYGIFSKRYAGLSLNPIDSLNLIHDNKTFDRLSMELWDLPEGIDVAHSAAAELQANELVDVPATQHVVAQLVFYQRIVRAIGEEPCVPAFEMQASLHEICLNIIDAAMATAPRTLILKNKRHLLALGMRALLALVAVVKMVSRSGCESEWGRHGSHHNDRTYQENSCSYGLTNDEIDHLSCAVTELVVKGTQPAAVEPTKLHAPHQALESGTPRRAKDGMGPSLFNGIQDGNSPAGRQRSQRNKQQLHDQSNRDAPGTRLDADGWVTALVELCVSLPDDSTRRSMLPSSVILTLKRKIERMLNRNSDENDASRPPTSSGGGYEVRHRNIIAACQIYLMVVCDAVKEWSEESALELLEKACEQGRQLGYSACPNPLPSMRDLLKSTNARGLPALLSLELYRRVVDEEVSRRAFLTRVAMRDEGVVELQFLNVTLSTEADASVGVAIRQARRDAEASAATVVGKHQSSSNAVRNGDDLKAQPRPEVMSAAATGDKSDAIIQRLHERMMVARSHWLQGMRIFLEQQITRVRGYIWRMHSAGAEGTVGASSGEKEAFPLPHDLKLRLLAHVDFLEKVVTTRDTAGEKLVRGAQAELRACVREVWRVLEVLLDTMSAFERPLFERLQWLFRQELAIKQQISGMVSKQSHKIKLLHDCKRNYELLLAAQKVFKTGELELEWPNARVRKILEDPDDDGLQQCLDDGREEYRELMEEQERLQAQWNSLITKRMVTILPRASKIKLRNSFRAAAYLVKDGLKFLRSSKIAEDVRETKADEEVLTKVRVPEIKLEVYNKAKDEVVEVDDDILKRAMRRKTLQADLKKRVRSVAERIAFAEQATSAALVAAAHDVYEKERRLRSTASLIHRLGSSFHYMDNFAHMSPLQSVQESNNTAAAPLSVGNNRVSSGDQHNPTTPVSPVLVSSAPTFSDLDIVRKTTVLPDRLRFHLPKKATFRISEATGSSDDNDHTTAIDDTTARSRPFPSVLERGSLPSQVQVKLPTRSEAAVNKTEFVAAAGAAGAAVAVPLKLPTPMPLLLPVTEMSVNWLPMMSDDAYAPDGAVVSGPAEQDNITTKAAANTLQDIPLDAYHPAIADILAREPRRLFLGRAHTSHSASAVANHESSSGMQSGHHHFHRKQDENKLHTRKKMGSRLTLGDSIAPWLFDLQYLLPEAPLLMPTGSSSQAGAAVKSGELHADGQEPSAREIKAFETLFGLQEAEESDAASHEQSSAGRTKDDPLLDKGGEAQEEEEEEDHDAAYEQTSSIYSNSSNMSDMSLSVLFQSLWAAELGATLHFSEAQDRFDELRDTSQRTSSHDTDTATATAASAAVKWEPSKAVLLQYVTRTAHKHEPDAPATVSSVLSRSLTAEQQREISFAYRAFKSKHEHVTAVPAAAAQPRKGGIGRSYQEIITSPKPVPIAPACEGPAIAPHAPTKPMPSFSPRRK